MVTSSLDPDNIAGFWKVVVTYYNDLDQQLPATTTEPEYDDLYFLVYEHPSITFTYSPTNVVVDESVQFSSTPSGGTTPYSFLWDFGDTGNATI